MCCVRVSPVSNQLGLLGSGISGFCMGPFPIFQIIDRSCSVPGSTFPSVFGLKHTRIYERPLVPAASACHLVVILYEVSMENLLQPKVSMQTACKKRGPCADLFWWSGRMEQKKEILCTSAASPLTQTQSPAKSISDAMTHEQYAKWRINRHVSLWVQLKQVLAMSRWGLINRDSMTETIYTLFSYLKKAALGVLWEKENGR